METDEKSGNNRRDVLTGIQDSYILSAKNEQDTGEINNLMIKHFLNTLADIALSVASRQGAEK